MRYLFILLATFLCIQGCTTYYYQDLGKNLAARYANTQPGYHRLSKHFSINVDNHLTKFYLLPGQNKSKQLIGTVRTFWFHLSDYGPRESVYAISADGRRLLFYHEQAVVDGKPDNLKNGVAVADLYLFDVVDGKKTRLYRDVHRLGISCVEFPMNFIRFGKVLPSGDILPIAFSTESLGVTLEGRRQRLYQSGNQDKVCGPL